MNVGIHKDGSKKWNARKDTMFFANIYFDQCLLQSLVSQEVTEGSWANACLQFSRLSDHWLTQQRCLHHARPSTPQMIVFRFEGISNNNASLSLSFTFLIPIRAYPQIVTFTTRAVSCKLELIDLLSQRCGELKLTWHLCPLPTQSSGRMSRSLKGRIQSFSVVLVVAAVVVIIIAAVLLL